MPANAVILEDVKKLLALGLSKEQLIQELAGVGVTRAEAENLYSEALGIRPISTYAPPAAPYIPPVTATPKETPVVIAAPKTDNSLEKLWEKGVIATVDAKLNQMDQLKQDIDNVLESKISEKAKSQEKKMEVLFESQRDLVLAKIEAQMASKVKEVDSILTQKIEEIKRINLATQEDLQRVKGQRLMITDLMADLQTKTAMLDQFRRTLNDDTARKLDQMQTQVTELLQTSEARLQEAEMRATNTLQIEEKIAAGLAQQVEQQANSILESRIKDLRGQLQNEMTELRRLETEMSPEQVQMRITQMNKELDSQISKIQEQFSSKEMESRIQKVIEQKQRTMLQFLEAEVEKMKQEMEEKAKSVREIVGELVTTRKSLEEFAQNQKKLAEDYKRQADQSVDSRVAQINQVVETKIEGYIDSKEREIMAEVNKQLPKVMEMKKELEDRQKNLTQLVQEAETAKTELTDFAQKKLQTLDSTLETKMASLINAKQKEFDSRVKEGMDEISRMRSDASQKSVEVQALKDNMDLFKDQFLSTLKQANLDRQDETKLFRQKMADFDVKADAKIALVDDRLRKLDQIVDQLAQTLQQLQPQGAAPAPKPPAAETKKK